MIICATHFQFVCLLYICISVCKTDGQADGQTDTRHTHNASYDGIRFVYLPKLISFSEWAPYLHMIVHTNTQEFPYNYHITYNWVTVAQYKNVFVIH